LGVVRALLATCPLVVLAVSCGTRADHERMGDLRYAEGAWVDALAEYRLAARTRQPSLELRAKIGAAALRAGALEEAAAAWRQLAESDASAQGEAVEGLVRTARAAVAARDVPAQRRVAEALEKLAPHRLGEAFGSALGQALTPEQQGRGDLMLVAAGHAGAASESLVVVWGEIAARSGRCRDAVLGWQGLLRRRLEVGLARRARAGIAWCRVEEGRTALSEGRLEEAVGLLAEATQPGLPDSLSRLAWVLIGDAQWAAGDSALAVEAYRKATARGDESNPLVQRALEQLRRLTGNPMVP
jgi:tetratricopeptide (TPR) repeat protein